MKLFQDYVEPPKFIGKPKIERPKPKRKAKIIIGESTYKCADKEGQPFISVDFEGWNEGSGSPCDTWEEAQKHIEDLKKRYSETYDIKVIDERPREKKYGYLMEWKNFIDNLCKEKGQEAEIWFDTSAPMDCAVNVRIKGHKCYYECISFRFTNGILEAYDGGFQSPFGGTNFVWNKTHQTHLDRREVISKMMERVLNNECCANCNESNPRIHEVDENFWLLRDGIHNLLKKDD